MFLAFSFILTCMTLTKVKLQPNKKKYIWLPIVSFRGRIQNIMDHPCGPGPWTTFVDPVHGPPLWTTPVDHPYFYKFNKQKLQ